MSGIGVELAVREGVVSFGQPYATTAVGLGIVGTERAVGGMNARLVTADGTTEARSFAIGLDPGEVAREVAVGQRGGLSVAADGAADGGVVARERAIGELGLHVVQVQSAAPLVLGRVVLEDGPGDREDRAITVRSCSAANMPSSMEIAPPRSISAMSLVPAPVVFPRKTHGLPSSAGFDRQRHAGVVDALRPGRFAWLS